MRNEVAPDGPVLGMLPSRAAPGLALLLAMAPAVGAAHLGQVSCDALSPLDNHCQAGPFRIGKHAEPYVSVLLGFVGQVELRLTEEGGNDQMTWTCHVLVEPTLPAVSGCSGGVGEFPDETWVRLRCDAKVYRLLGQSIAGPAGAWECGVRV